MPTKFPDEFAGIEQPDPTSVKSHWHGLHYLVDDAALAPAPGDWLAEEFHWTHSYRECIESPVELGIAALKSGRIVKSLTRTRERSPLRTDLEVRVLFDEYRERWQEETAITSNVTRKIAHEDYQRIIGLGPQALPYILTALEADQDDWFWALFAIVGRDVAAGAETVGDATERWVQWGRDRGYLD